VNQLPLEGDALREFLEAVRLGHWATVSPDGTPRVRPVWYVYVDGAFWFTTRIASRHTGTDVTEGSSVAVSIASEDRPYRAVVAYGTPEVWDEDRDAWLERIAIRYGEKEGRSWLAGAIKEPDRVVLRMVPDRVIAWHYGTGDYGRRQKGTSLAVDLP
jgi:nitroimidazol reductase NimA-like FMN-containing flavoprotein (pyridoxamine 5'-phosphate oxidase superfamily)